MKLHDLQREHAEWQEKNFGFPSPEQLFLGVVEEVGELAHAQLKMAQGIRGVGEADVKDAVGDVVIFLAGFCTAMGYDFGKIVETTWSQVKQRDWTKNRKDGVA